MKKYYIDSKMLPLWEKQKESFDGHILNQGRAHYSSVHSYFLNFIPVTEQIQDDR